MMNQVHCILISLILPLSSCVDTQGEQEYSTAQEETVDSNSVVVPDILHGWQGNLDGRIPVLIWYKEQSGMLQGSLYYTNQKTPAAIKLIGQVDSNQHRLLEFMPDGTITGIWHLTISRSSAEGVWYAPTPHKSFNASLMHIDTAVTITNFDKPKHINGKYAYMYGDSGDHGYLAVTQKNNMVTLNFDNVTGAPAHNMAMLETAPLPLTNNTVSYRSSEFGACEFSVQFFKGFAVVKYKDQKGDCGFGHGAHIEGIYTEL